MQFLRTKDDIRTLLGEERVALQMKAWLEKLGFRVGTPSHYKGRGFDLDARNPSTGEWYVIEAKGGLKDRDASNVASSAVANALMTAVDWVGREDLVNASKAIAIPESFWFDAHSARYWSLTKHLPVTVFSVPREGSCSLVLLCPPRVIRDQGKQYRESSNIAVHLEWAGSNYSACVPALPGCVATGSTIEETQGAMREAIHMHIAGLCEDQSIPRA
jgi:predicted RNase H-like HicB family nuclease